MEVKNVKNGETNDLNLLDLLIILFRWFKNTLICLFNVLLKSFRFCIQNFWILFAFIVVATVCGWVFTSPKFVKSKGEATILFVPQNRATVAKNLEMLASVWRDTARTKQLLDIDDMTASKLRDLKTYNFCYSKPKFKGNSFHYDWVFENVYGNRVVGEPDRCGGMSNMGDTTYRIMPDRLLVSIKAKNLTDYNPIFEKIAAFLLKNPELNATHVSYLNQKQEQYNYYSNEIARLDSLSDQLYFRSPEELQVKVDKNLFIGEVSKQMIYKNVEELYRWKQQLSYELGIYSEPISYLSPAVLIFPNRWLNLFYWMLGGLAVGCLVALCVRFRKEIAAYMSEK